jgi:hypothetical protein
VGCPQHLHTPPSQNQCGMMIFGLSQLTHPVNKGQGLFKILAWFKNALLRVTQKTAIGPHF